MLMPFGFDVSSEYQGSHPVADFMYNLQGYSTSIYMYE